MAELPRLSIVLLDADDYFCEMVAIYIRTTDYSEKIEFRCFSDQAKGVQFLEKLSGDSSHTILLVHESFLELTDAMLRQRAGCVIVVSEQPAGAGAAEFPVLCKYQPLNRFLAAVTAHYSTYCEPIAYREREATEIVAFYSATGGTGKTTAAAHFSRQCADQGEKVFYVNLEQLPTYSKISDESGEEQDEAFSQLIYLLRTKLEAWPAKLDLYKRTHSLWRYEYIPPTMRCEELEQLTAEDVRRWITSLAKLRRYDRIVLDLDSQLHPSVLAGLELSDRVMWILSDDYNHGIKTLMHMRRLNTLEKLTRLQEKSVMYLNRCERKAHAADRRLERLDVVGCLPEVPDWCFGVNGPAVYSPGYAACTEAMRTVKPAGGREERSERVLA